MTAIVKADAVDIAGELPQIFRLATALVKAGDFLPRHIRTEGALVAVILAGRELGIAPMASLRSIHLVEGRVTLAADTQLALMVRAGVTYQWLGDGSDGAARLKLVRPGQPEHVQTWTLDMARTAGLLGKDNWKKYPAAMLRARCVSSAARAYMPDILAGVFIPDELEDERPEPARVEVVAVSTAEPPKDEATATREPSAPDGSLSKRDEYGIAIPSHPCPVFTKDGPNKGKRWDEAPGPLIEKMYEQSGEAMSTRQREWCEYLMAKRVARKAKEAREAEATAAVDAAISNQAPAATDDGGWVASDEPRADGEAAQ